MNKPRLLSNLPIQDLTVENDYLGIIDKGDLIKAFLKGNKDQFHEIKMFSIYGEWGSGKSSLMKYLKKELDGEFNTFFFEAWEYEKDENLAMSLLEYITSKNTDISKEFFDNVVKYGGRVLRGLGKSVKMNIPLFTNGPAFEIDPSAFVEEVTKSEELTFQKALDNFKTEFVRFEDAITGGDNPKYNIVFIDDLDRCEPEQVLNLLSAIKLFFTYGKKTIFFCGIDKKAVEQAVKTKYGKVVKANEYMEKIFDISFNMPEHENLIKLISNYFDDREIPSTGDNLNISIEQFIQFIGFRNPRRLKKVLNKYSILSSFKFGLKGKEGYNLIPNIIVGSDGNYFETILTLYILILSEFEKEYFDIFNNLTLKKELIKNSIIKKHSFLKNAETEAEITRAQTWISTNGSFRKSFKRIKTEFLEKKGKPSRQTPQEYEKEIRRKFCIHFVNPKNIDFYDFSFSSTQDFVQTHSQEVNRIDYLFVLYLLDSYEFFMNEDLSDFRLSDFKLMIDKLL